MKLFRMLRYLLLPMLMLLCYTSGAQTTFNRQAYYHAFAANKEEAVNAQLKIVTTLSGNERGAFEGALLMRKAGIESNLAEKLSLFRKGGKQLEAAIKAQPGNVEYRFLRLMIQENAPQILGYNDNIKEDSTLIKRQLKSLDPATQQAINNYAKQSKHL